MSVVDERQPLLAGARPPAAEEDNSKKANSQATTARSRAVVVILLNVCLLLFTYADALQVSPRIRIFESIICYRYYEQHDPSQIRAGRDVVGPGAIGGVDELACKVDAVASDLASLIGYLDMFSMIPGLLLALPFGWVADKYGRWPVIMLNLVQFVLGTICVQLLTWFWQASDIRLVWTSAAFAILGGGNGVIGPVFFVATADVVSAEHRAAAFLRLGAVNYSAGLFMPPLAAALMTLNPWIPYLAGTGLFIIATGVFLLVPETKDYPEATAGEHRLSAPQRNLDDSIESTATSDDGMEETDPIWAKKHPILHELHSLLQFLSFLLEDWRIPLLLLPFTTHLLVGNIDAFLLQYLSKRYALPTAEATLLTSIRTGAVTLTMSLLLPTVADLLARRTPGAPGASIRKDLHLARASELLFCAGWLGVALAPSWPLATAALVGAAAGQGGILMARSVLTAWIPPHRIARVYSLIGLIDATGALVGFPLLAALFRRGLEWGGAWVGLPFFFISLVSAGYVVIYFAVPAERGQGKGAIRLNEAEEDNET